MQPKCQIGDYAFKKFKGTIEGVQVEISKELVVTGIWMDQNQYNAKTWFMYRLSECFPREGTIMNPSRLLGRTYDCQESEFTLMGPTENEIRKKQEGH